MHSTLCHSLLRTLGPSGLPGIPGFSVDQNPGILENDDYDGGDDKD